MSSKAAIVETVRELILRREAVTDNQRTVHYKRAEEIVGYAFDTLLAQIQMEENGEREIEAYFVKHYYNQSVRESNGYRYIGLEDNFVELDGGRGIWYVQPSGGGVNFGQSRRPKNALFNSLPVGSVIKETFFRVGNVNSTSRRQIVLEDVGESPTTDIRKVDYGIVRNFKSYSDTEDVNMPDGRYDLLLQMATEAFGARPNDTITNDA